LAVYFLEVIAPQSHCLNPATDWKGLENVFFSLIMAYFEFEEGLRFCVTIDAKVPSLFMTIGAAANDPMELNFSTIYAFRKKQQHS
jgi:hypothetical protein